MSRHITADRLYRAAILFVLVWAACAASVPRDAFYLWPSLGALAVAWGFQSWASRVQARQARP